MKTLCIREGMDLSRGGIVSRGADQLSTHSQKAAW